jgi:LPXTG-site transpeptidase (sortase) family protein
VNYYFFSEGIMKFSGRNPANLVLRALLIVGILMAALPATGVSAATYTLAITSGNSQTASTNIAFANPLQVRVTRIFLGIPIGVNGATVTYTVPGSGASAVLSSTTATTASSGLIAGYASVTATANATAGSYTVSAQVTGINTSNIVSFNLTNVDIPYISAITLAGTSPTNATSVDFNLAFTQPVSPVVAGDFSLSTTGGESGATITGVTPTSGFNTNYVVSVATVSGAGTIRLDVADTDATIKNGSGNSLGITSYSTGPSDSIDRIAPTVVSITRVSASPTELGMVTFTVNFSEPVSGVIAGAFTLTTTGGQSDAAISGSPICVNLPNTSCIVSVTTGTGDGTLGLNLLASSGIHDNVGNTVAGPFTGEVYDVIKIAPEVVSINRAGSTPTNASSVDFTVTFSEGVSGVDPTDFVTTFDGTLGGISITGVTPVSDTVYTVTVNTGSGDGTLGLNLVDDDSIRDFAHPIPHYLGTFGKGNGDHTGDQAYTIDRTAPTVIIGSSASDPTNTSPIPVTVTFIESVTGFTAGSVAVGNGAISGFSGSGTSYSFDLTPGSVGLVTVDIAAGVATDAAGNGNAAALQFSITYDNNPPTVTISSTASSPTNVSPIPVTFTFSKSVSGFALGKITVVNGTAGNFATLSGSQYTADITPSANGTVTVDVAAGVATDAAGNGNIAASTFSITYDTGAPAVSSILRHTPASSPTNATNVTFRVTFSKDVQNVDLGDFSLVLTGSVTGALNTVTPVSASVYDVNINLVAGNGTLALGFAAGNNITDLADNQLGTSPAVGTNENYIIDNLAIIVIDKGVIGNPGLLTITDGSRYTRHFTNLEVLFNKDAFNPAGDTDPEDVTNPDNYLLLQAGPNKVFDTVICAKATGPDFPHAVAAVLPAGDDIQIPAGPVTYDNNSGNGPFIATVTVNNGNPLPAGQYRLFICGTTSINDLVGNHLNGGVDSILTFHIYDPAPAAAAVPATGFAPQRVMALPIQPARRAYTPMSDLWLEIPRLGVRMNILGVPQSADGTWDVSWLGNAAGWLNGSAYPTWNGNSVLTGHVYAANGQPGPFVHLNQLWWGDQVIVHAGGAQYVYEVRSVLMAGPQDVSTMLKHQELPWLTLVTCRGYDEASNSYQYRVLVRAVLVEVK